MAKIIPMELIKSMSGKVCMHSDTYFARRFGAVYTGKICNPRTSDPSAAELEARNDFATARAMVDQLMTDPSKVQMVMAAWAKVKGYSKYKTMRGWLIAGAIHGINAAQEAADGSSFAWPTTAAGFAAL